MNNEDSGNELFGISEQLREKKHDPDCDCGICQYCNGTEDIYGNSTAPIKIANLEAELAALKTKLDAANTSSPPSPKTTGPSPTTAPETSANKREN